jgi:hypothetical protein
MENKELSNRLLFTAFCFLLLACSFSACKTVKYSLKDSSIPPEIKTIKMGLFENKARYINPQLAPKLNQNLQSKLVSQTGRQPSTRDDADYVISGFINDYTVSTSGISGGQVSSNRLTVGVHIVLQDNKNQKQDEYDVSKSFEFPGTQTITDVENSLTDQIVTGLTTEIFNKLFSGW